MDWFLYNGYTGLNGKMVNINLYVHVLVFISSSIFHFRLSCLGENYYSSLKVTKNLLGMIFNFNIISAQYLPLKVPFYQFYNAICRHHESIVLSLKFLAQTIIFLLHLDSQSFKIVWKFYFSIPSYRSPWWYKQFLELLVILHLALFYYSSKITGDQDMSFHWHLGSVIGQITI